MSALSIATLGVQCESRPVSMATLGVFCFEDVIERVGGHGKTRRRAPGITSNRNLAMTEDEEIVVILQALLASRRKH